MNELILRGLEGNPPAGRLTGMQETIAPFAPSIISLYWLLWSLILGYVVGRFIVLRGWRELSLSAATRRDRPRSDSTRQAP